jgi:RimJ/RimL family protein N-acetyltransferase
MILQDNRQSIRVAEKNGLKLEKKALFHEKIHRVYRLAFKEEIP